MRQLMNIYYEGNAGEPVVDFLINFHFSQMTGSNLEHGCIGQGARLFLNSPFEGSGHCGCKA